MKVKNATLLLTVLAQLLGNFAIEFAIASSMPLNCTLDSPLLNQMYADVLFNNNNLG